MAVNVVSFSFSWCSTGGPRVYSAGCWLSLLHLISNFSGPQTPSGFPYHISSISVSNSTGTATASRTQLSWLSYIIVQRPLDLWNRMFDHHPAEITVMQFTGHCLSVRQSMRVSCDFYLVPFHQLSTPTRSLSITGHWNVSLPSGASLCMVFLTGSKVKI